LTRIHTREEEEEQREKEQSEKRDRDMRSPSLPNSNSAGSSALSIDKTSMNSILNGDKTNSPSPLRRPGPLHSATDSNNTSRKLAHT
jgi:hypothetical protein